MEEATRDALARLIGYHFAALVSRNPQPCMSGDPRDRLLAHDRRRFETAEREAANAVIGSLAVMAALSPPPLNRESNEREQASRDLRSSAGV